MVKMTLLVAALIMGVATSEATSKSRHHSNGNVHSLVSSIASRHGVPHSLAHGIVRVESGYRCQASNKGALGAMQIKRQTARGVGIVGNLNDCSVGIEAGMREISRFLRQTGNLCVAASAYQRGSIGGCSAYGRKVLRNHW